MTKVQKRIIISVIGVTNFGLPLSFYNKVTCPARKDIIFMSENEKKEAVQNDDDVIHMNDEKKHSVVDNVRKAAERERRQQIEEESRKAEQLAERERAERDAYAKKLAEERIELMKLKAGVISEEELPKEEKTEKAYTTGEKIGNFFYHNKAYIIIITIIAAIAIFLIYDIATKIDPDVAVMIVVTDDEFSYRTDRIKSVLEQYCEDFNGDGHISVRVSYLPAIPDETKSQAELYYSSSDQTKLISEFQGGDSIVIIADEKTCEALKITDGILADMRTIYPDDENAEELGYMLSGTNFAEDIKYTNMADDLFIGFRVPRTTLSVNQEKFKRNYENALRLWDNYLNGNIVNPQTEEE